MGISTNSKKVGCFVEPLVEKYFTSIGLNYPPGNGSDSGKPFRNNAILLSAGIYMNLGKH